MTKKIAYFAGSFDPPTLGHWDVINKAAKVFDLLYVGLGHSSQKKSLFSVAERLAMLRVDCDGLSNVEVCEVEGLTFQHALDLGAAWLVRSVRNHVDFDYELQIAASNRELSAGKLETWFVAPDPRYIHINSSIVREILSHGNNCKNFVTPSVFRILSERS